MKIFNQKEVGVTKKFALKAAMYRRIARMGFNNPDYFSKEKLLELYELETYGKCKRFAQQIEMNKGKSGKDRVSIINLMIKDNGFAYGKKMRDLDVTSWKDDMLDGTLFSSEIMQTPIQRIHNRQFVEDIMRKHSKEIANSLKPMARMMLSNHQEHLNEHELQKMKHILNSDDLKNVIEKIKQLPRIQSQLKEGENYIALQSEQLNNINHLFDDFYNKSIKPLNEKLMPFGIQLKSTQQIFDLYKIIQQRLETNQIKNIDFSCNDLIVDVKSALLYLLENTTIQLSNDVFTIVNNQENDISLDNFQNLHQQIFNVATSLNLLIRKINNSVYNHRVHEYYNLYDYFNIIEPLTAKNGDDAYWSIFFLLAIMAKEKMLPMTNSMPFRIQKLETVLNS